MVHVVLPALTAVALGMVGLGVAGLTTGWIHPWERGRVLRLVPHGLGHIFSGCGFFCFCVFFLFALSDEFSLKSLAGGAVLFSIGVVLRGVAAFPDR
ncbi:hypothetical protein QWL27_31915 [Streptomyces thermocarboxydus]|uniref:Integral membrane protein n=1 Tax=Streptomyces cellulosae TaxID=1968 RepID=A0ABW6JFL9_STRCE|nr:hypothetical protein [Streptomyces sp. AC04842]MDN3290322.1 hypothetical protein [Streptomyces thermocarboxydus]GHE63521.1 hypothetical protein GCM10018771_51700 [Streptomyces cellulosae]